MTPKQPSCPSCGGSQRSRYLREYVRRNAKTQYFVPDPIDGIVRCVQCVDVRQRNWEKSKHHFDELVKADDYFRSLPPMSVLLSPPSSVDAKMSDLMGDDPPDEALLVIEQQRKMVGALNGICQQLAQLLTPPLVPASVMMREAIRWNLQTIVIHAYHLAKAYGEPPTPDPRIRLVKPDTAQP